MAQLLNEIDLSDTPGQGLMVTKISRLAVMIGMHCSKNMKTIIKRLQELTNPKDLLKVHQYIIQMLMDMNNDDIIHFFLSYPHLIFVDVSTIKYLWHAVYNKADSYLMVAFVSAYLRVLSEENSSFSKDHLTPLHLCSQNAKMPVWFFDAFLQLGLPLTALDTRGKSILDHAIKNSNVDLLEFLKNKKCWVPLAAREEARFFVDFSKLLETFNKQLFIM